MAATPPNNGTTTNPATRKSNRRMSTRRDSSDSSSASPTLAQKRRRGQPGEEAEDFFDCEPSSKRMASADCSDKLILQAILKLGQEVTGKAFFFNPADPRGIT